MGDGVGGQVAARVGRHGHHGMDVDVTMAGRVRGIDAILGGHTHDGVPVASIVSNAGGKTIGLNIGLPFEQRPNPFITPQLHFEFHYFFMRKFWFAYLAKALVVFPGGFGTLDEMFEILTLVQTDKLSKKIGVVLYGSEYWKQVLDLKPMAEWGAIAEKDLELLHYADTPADAFAHLRDHLIAHHVEPSSAYTFPPGPIPAARSVDMSRFTPWCAVASVYGPSTPPAS